MKLDSRSTDWSPRPKSEREAEHEQEVPDDAPGRASRARPRSGPCSIAISEMISSGAFPNVAFRKPPMPGPVWWAACSVASPISHASGMSASAASDERAASRRRAKRSRRRTSSGRARASAQRILAPHAASYPRDAARRALRLGRHTHGLRLRRGALEAGRAARARPRSDATRPCARPTRFERTSASTTCRSSGTRHARGDRVPGAHPARCSGTSGSRSPTRSSIGSSRPSTPPGSRPG